MRVYTLAKDEKERIIESLREVLLRQEDILFAYLHGSFLEGGPFRDVDVAIYVDSNVHPFYEEELSRLIGFPVDVRVINDVPITFKFRVMGGLLLFSRDEKIRCDFEERTMGEYHDYSYYLEMYRRETLEI